MHNVRTIPHKKENKILRLKSITTMLHIHNGETEARNCQGNCTTALAL